MTKEFKISVPEPVILDLYERLDRARWPDEVGSKWKYGTDRGYLQELCQYWRHGFDWRKQEALLNRFNQFTTRIDDRTVHFIHQRSSHQSAMPLLITHGWPGSFSEFEKIIEPLTEPTRYGGRAEDAFHVICPSIPGYGFSEAPTSPGFDDRSVARNNIKLMEQLGYARYGLQGGDWGSAISTWHARLAPEAVTGLHLNLIFAGFPKHKADPFEGVTDAEKELLAGSRETMKDGAGYQQIQGTRPQTLGYGLHDSPVGLAAWITEKFYYWTDCNSQLESCISKDELLTNIMIYWVTGTITSSCRLYYETAHADAGSSQATQVKTPTGYALFPGELYLPPRKWAEEVYNIIQWTRMPRGGHFAALEQPDLLVNDMRNFFARFR